MNRSSLLTDINESDVGEVTNNNNMNLSAILTTAKQETKKEQNLLNLVDSITKNANEKYRKSIIRRAVHPTLICSTPFPNQTADNYSNSPCLSISSLILDGQEYDQDQNKEYDDIRTNKNLSNISSKKAESISKILEEVIENPDKNLSGIGNLSGRKSDILDLSDHSKIKSDHEEKSQHNIVDSIMKRATSERSLMSQTLNKSRKIFGHNEQTQHSKGKKRKLIEDSNISESEKSCNVPCEYENWKMERQIRNDTVESSEESRHYHANINKKEEKQNYHQRYVIHKTKQKRYRPVSTTRMSTSDIEYVYVTDESEDESSFRKKRRKSKYSIAIPVKKNKNKIYKSSLGPPCKSMRMIAIDSKIPKQNMLVRKSHYEEVVNDHDVKQKKLKTHKHRSVSRASKVRYVRKLSSSSSSSEEESIERILESETSVSQYHDDERTHDYKKSSRLTNYREPSRHRHTRQHRSLSTVGRYTYMYDDVERKKNRLSRLEGFELNEMRNRENLEKQKDEIPISKPKPEDEITNSTILQILSKLLKDALAENKDSGPSKRQESTRDENVNRKKKSTSKKFLEKSINHRELNDIDIGTNTDPGPSKRLENTRVENLGGKHKTLIGEVHKKLVKSPLEQFLELIVVPELNYIDTGTHTGPGSSKEKKENLDGHYKELIEKTNKKLESSPLRKCLKNSMIIQKLSPVHVGKFCAIPLSKNHKNRLPKLKKLGRDPFIPMLADIIKKRTRKCVERRKLCDIIKQLSENANVSVQLVKPYKTKRYQLRSTKLIFDDLTDSGIIRGSSDEKKNYDEIQFNAQNVENEELMGTDFLSGSSKKENAKEVPHENNVQLVGSSDLLPNIEEKKVSGNSPNKKQRGESTKTTSVSKECKTHKDTSKSTKSHSRKSKNTNVPSLDHDTSDDVTLQTPEPTEMQVKKSEDMGVSVQLHPHNDVLDCVTLRPRKPTKSQGTRRSTREGKTPISIHEILMDSRTNSKKKQLKARESTQSTSNSETTSDISTKSVESQKETQSNKSVEKKPPSTESDKENASESKMVVSKSKKEESHSKETLKNKKDGAVKKPSKTANKGKGKSKKSPKKVKKSTIPNDEREIPAVDNDENEIPAVYYERLLQIVIPFSEQLKARESTQSTSNSETTSDISTKSVESQKETQSNKSVEKKPPSTESDKENASESKMVVLKSKKEESHSKETLKNKKAGAVKKPSKTANKGKGKSKKSPKKGKKSTIPNDESEIPAVDNDENEIPAVDNDHSDSPAVYNDQINFPAVDNQIQVAAVDNERLLQIASALEGNKACAFTISPNLGLVAIAPNCKKCYVNDRFEQWCFRVEGTYSLKLQHLCVREPPSEFVIPKGVPAEIINTGVNRVLFLIILK